MESFEQDVIATKTWFSKPRFEEITRLYSPRQVVEQRGTIERDYSIAKHNAAAFYQLLRELFASYHILFITKDTTIRQHSAVALW